MSTPKVWFITGASSGFGLAMSEAALKQGDKVVATLRKPEVLADLQSRYSDSQLLVAKLDVTNAAEIEATFAEAKNIFGGIDVVFNNAGYVTVGEIEGTPDDTARSLFDAVFFGAANVSRTAVKYFRENTPMGGLLIQVSTLFAFQAAPGSGYYSAAKAALEGFSEALANEVDPSWNIRVTLVEPGPFKTKATFENATVLPRHPAYTNEALPANMFRSMINVPQNPSDGDAAKAVLVIRKLARLEKVPFRFPLHRQSIALARHKAKNLNEAADTWESWSEDVYL